MRPTLLFYRAMTWLAILVGLPYLVYRWRKHPEEMRERWGGSAPLFPQPDALEAERSAPPAPPAQDQVGTGTALGPVWVHAASLGEVEAAKAWMEDEPLEEGCRWFVTVTSTSARRRAPERLGGVVPVRFAPLDHDIAVGRFLLRHRPRALVLIETELWPITLDRCRRAGIPVYVVSGRITRPGWKKMRHVVRLYWEVASAIRAAAVQGPEDEKRYRTLFVRSVRVCGNVKYRVPERTEGVPGSDPAPASGDGSPAMSAERFRPSTPTVTHRLLWVIGSLRRGEEAVLGAARAAAERGVAVVLAPRHLRERDAWIGECRRAGLEPILRSETAGPVPLRGEGLPEALFPTPGADGAARPPILLVDVHGELRSWYRCADAATVGGTWIPIGGHNLFEPLCEGVPVSFGPYTENVRDVAAAAQLEGAALEAENPGDLVAWVLAQADPATGQKMERSALRAARNLAGAGERTRAFLSGAEAAEDRGGVFRPSARETRAEIERAEN